MSGKQLSWITKNYYKVRCFNFCLCFQDDTSKSSSTANELGLANVGGVFVVLMGGMGIACVIAVCEFVWKSRKVAIEEKVMKLPDQNAYPSLLH